MLANTTDITKYGMTCRAINTLDWSDDTFDFNITIVESNKKHLEQGFVYHTKTIVPDDKFGYNKYLNHGLNSIQNLSEWVIITNNDVIFTLNWFTNLMNVSEQRPDILSFSPWEPNWHKKRGMTPDKLINEGYRTSFEITGWCLVMHRDVIYDCKLFDPAFEFWYQDNDYALTLQKHNIKHALISNSRVYHMVSGSHDTLPNENKHHMTDGQVNVLYNKWGTNV